MSATRLIDPSEDDLLAAFAATVKADPRPLLARAGAERQGVEYLDWDSGQATVAAWWPDAVGRRHWAIRPEALVEKADLPGEHPLTWIAPPLAGCWRERGGRREFVVICRCGAAGTPESVGWMGQTCGPCHDREVEGLAPLGPELRRADLAWADDVWLTAGGTLVARGFERDEATEVIDGTHAVRAYAGVDDGRLLWEHGLGDADRVAVGVPGVVIGGRTRVEVLDPRTGRRLHGFETDETALIALAVAGPDLLFTLHPERLRAWRLRPFRPPQEEDGGPLTAPAFARILPSPRARSVLLIHRDEARLIYPSGSRTSRQVFDGFTSAAVWLPDGALILSGFSPKSGTFLGRWDNPERAEGPSRLHRLVAADHARHLALAPDGAIIARRRYGLFVHDPTTLAIRSDIFQENLSFSGEIAFTPDGRVLIPAYGGLAAWPYRGLLG